MENGTTQEESRTVQPELDDFGQDDQLALMERLGGDDQFIDRFERGVEHYKRWQAACFRLTSEHHWINHGSEDKPSYQLDAAGSEALMVPLGINYDQPRLYRVDKTHPQHGPYYLYICEGIAASSVLRRSGAFIGAASSLDKFFSSNPGFDPERDEGHVMKKALSNWEVNVVGRLAGIRRPSEEVLKKAGLNPKQISRVDYSGNSSESKGAQVISEAQAKRLYAIAKKIDADRMKSYLKFRGYESSKDILRRDYESICTWAEKGGPDWEEKATANKSGVRTITDGQRNALKAMLTSKDISIELLNGYLEHNESCTLDTLPAERLEDISEMISSGWLKKWAAEEG